MSTRMVVVLPAPLGPRNPNTTPGGTVRSTPLIPRADPVGLGELLGLHGSNHTSMVVSARSSR